jgi:hypothetical protein
MAEQEPKDAPQNGERSKTVGIVRQSKFVEHH